MYSVHTRMHTGTWLALVDILQPNNGFMYDTSVHQFFKVVNSKLSKGVKINSVCTLVLKYNVPIHQVADMTEGQASTLLQLCAAKEAELLGQPEPVTATMTPAAKHFQDCLAAALAKQSTEAPSIQKQPNMPVPQHATQVGHSLPLQVPASTVPFNGLLREQLAQGHATQQRISTPMAQGTTQKTAPGIVLQPQPIASALLQSNTNNAQQLQVRSTNNTNNQDILAALINAQPLSGNAAASLLQHGLNLPFNKVCPRFIHHNLQYSLRCYCSRP